MAKIKYTITLNLILIFNIFALIAAYFIEYVLGHQPCNLCLIERIPFVVVIIVILICLFLTKFEKISLFILSLVFLLASLISLYHFGIEQGFITESLVCNLDTKIDALTKESVLNQLKQKTISCKDVTFKVFGLSLATINIFICLILSAITFKLFLNYEKNK
jgi:disulfide bond formation protein DsbB